MGMTTAACSRAPTKPTAPLRSRVLKAPLAEAIEPAPVGPSAPRTGSKLARVIELLRRDHGATIDELIAATGIVTLPCREREVSAPQELSGRCDRRPPRGHRRSAKHAVRLGRGEMALDVEGIVDG